ncbi:uncharacterized protein EV154DRAFT_579136 [Mucor mucedo]|uniref:uncharacterized protein n=1 Tax=Mucor mucedo TaxID=29922 RepID=UPI00221F1D73|nr:uncharacterized protein EV154DRAFT_579136 [Mucor mucedo]KAI7873316.1 hypothetical protein EV154DRAFT_579136 [Mucor mucedo]
MVNDGVPSFMIEHIDRVIDVEKDGYCGFRVIAIALGRNEDDCYDIRKVLLMHLEKKKAFFFEVYLRWSFIPDCPQNKNKAISLVLLGEHYLSLNLKPDCPLPKLNENDRNRDRINQGFPTKCYLVQLFQDGIKKFEDLKTIVDGQIEKTTEYVDLIDSEEVDINHQKSAYKSDVKKTTQKQEITQKQEKTQITKITQKK